MLTEPPPYWRVLYLAVRPMLYGLLAAMDSYFTIESKRTKITIEH